MRELKLEPSESKAKIGRIILGFENPFNLSDLLIHCQKQGFENRNFITEVLDDIVDDGLVSYYEIEKDVWAYVSIFAKK